MKKVFYLRHAKSSWEQLDKTDIDRKLNARGNRDAPFMANKLRQYLDNKNIEIGAILCSTSARTTETIAHFTNTAFPKTSVIFDSSLYHASSGYLVECLFQLDDKIDNVIVCSHNPGISYLAFELDVDTTNIPTCAIYECSYNASSWLDVSSQLGRGGAFLYPKMYRDEIS